MTGEILNEPNIAIDIVLRRLIEKKDLKQSEVARAIGMAQSTFHDWTYGRIPRDLKTVRRLAEYFNVSFEYMVFGTKTDQDELKQRIKKLEFEKAMRELNENNQLDIFESPEEGRERIKRMREAFVEKYGVEP